MSASSQDHALSWLIQVGAQPPPDKHFGGMNYEQAWGKTFWSWNEVYLTFAFALALAVFRSFLARVFFVPIGRRFIPAHKPKRLSKWEENCWFEVYYPCAAIFGLWVVSDKAYSNNPYHFFTDYPMVDRPVEVMVYYCLGFGFYFQALFALVIWETRRKDFVEMVVHHVITLLLMGISWTLAYERIGLIVLLLHDIVDIFLYGTKILHYIGKKFENWTNISFACFAFVYLLVRMIYFPWRVILACHWRPDFTPPQDFFVKYEPRAGLFHYSAACIGFNNYCLSPFNFEVFLLCALYCLHLFWFSLIVKMIISALRESTVKQDVRSDSESDSDDEAEDTKKNR